jgi:predicted acylesterase/phospholipase RssA
MEKVILILPGGGVRCTFQMGFLHDFLKSEKYDITQIYASSMGAIIAPLVVNKKIDLLKNMFQEINKLEDIFIKWNWYYFPWIFKGFFNLFYKLSIYKSNKLFDLVWDKLSLIEKQKTYQILQVPAYNMKTNTEDWFFANENNNINDLYHMIKASSSLWMLTPPYEYNNNLYLDGGSCNLFPINTIINSSQIKTDYKIIFINNSPRIKKTQIKKANNVLELMYNLHDNTLDNVGNFQIDKLKTIFGDQLIIIYPDTELFINSIDFNKFKMLKNFEYGQEKYKNFECEQEKYRQTSL